MSLDVVDLSVDRGGRRVVDAVTFTLPTGSWCGLIGVNGAGKTTLLKALAGRLPVASGAVRIGQEALADPRRRARLVGMSVPPDRLPDAVTPDRLIAEVARAHGVDPRSAGLAPLHAALALDEIAGRRIAVLSLGQRQRVGLYLAFLGAPRLALLDEPFNALDPLIAFGLKQTLKDLARSGVTILTAVHDLPTVALHCDHGLLLSRGRLAQRFNADAIAAARRDPGAFEAEVLTLWRRAEHRNSAEDGHAP